MVQGIHNLGGDIAGEKAVSVDGGDALLVKSARELPGGEGVGQLAAPHITRCR